MNVLIQNTLIGKLYSVKDEWPGSTPCRFKPEGIKIAPQVLHPPKPERGKKHYYINEESKYEFMQKFGKKTFTETKLSQDYFIDRKSSIKRIIPKYSEPKVYLSHIIPNPLSIRAEKIRNMKQFPEKWNIDQKEYKWRNKKKLVSDNISMRNGMEIISPGEKLYKNVDYSPDFYKNEEWVVGSSNTTNFKKSSLENKGFYNSVDLTARTLFDNYNIRENHFNINHDKQYVSNLDKFDMILNIK